VFSATFCGAVTFSGALDPPSMTLSEIRIDKFCQLPLVSIFTFKPLSDAASPILRTLASAVFAPAFACTFPMAWQPVVHVDSYQGPL